jgi:hypothetical protein
MENARPTAARYRMSCALLVLLCFTSFAGFAQRKSIKQYVHQVWTTENGLPQNSAISFAQTRDGYIWFATYEGLVRFDGVEFRVFDRTNTKELPSSWFVRIKEDSVGGLRVRPGAACRRTDREDTGPERIPRHDLPVVDPEFTQYEDARLKSYLESTNGSDIRELIQGNIADLKKHTRGANQSDDITLLALRYAGAA